MTDALRPRLDAMREGGTLLAAVLGAVAAAVRPGITTAALDAIAAKQIREAGAQPAFLGYRGYPAVLCTSRNSVVVHGIPRADEVLAAGDIIGLDLGLVFQGFYTDMAVTVPVGTVSADVRRLLATAWDALEAGLTTIHDGVRTGDVGSAIQRVVEGRGFGVVRDLVGHGVGAAIHEDPSVPNFGRPGTGTLLTAGMTIAVEPMIARGQPAVETLADGWTVVTRDRSLAAHVEQTVAVTREGIEILTPFPHGLDPRH